MQKGVVSYLRKACFPIIRIIRAGKLQEAMTVGQTRNTRLTSILPSEYVASKLQPAVGHLLAAPILRQSNTFFHTIGHFRRGRTIRQSLSVHIVDGDHGPLSGLEKTMISQV
jgi:hypothetical protein